MARLNLLTFSVKAATELGPSAPLMVTPVVDGVSLVELVGSFEEQHGYGPAGGYSGLVPRYFRFGDLSSYYLGTGADQWPQPGHAWLLGCDCGEAGCWPLTARIIATPDTVSWVDFTQDHRPAWDYSDFGPFIFSRKSYDLAVRVAGPAVQFNSA